MKDHESYNTAVVYISSAILYFFFKGSGTYIFMAGSEALNHRFELLIEDR